MDYKKLQNGSDIRGVALEGVEGQSENLTEKVCRDIGRGFAVWLYKKTGKTNLTNKDVDELYPIKKDLDFRLD